MAARWQGAIYLSAAGGVMAIDIDTSQGLRLGTPHSLFKVDGALSDWGVTADGNRFLLAVPAKQSAPAPFTVVLNWNSAMKKF